MARAPASLTSVSLLLLLSIPSSSPARTPFPTTEPPFDRVVKAIKLNGGYMEIVQEEHCSHDVLRLTCRSLKAFIFVLEADYQSNRTEACGLPGARALNGDSLARLRASFALKGNYVSEPDEFALGSVDLRQSLNKRCAGQKHCRYDLSTDHPGSAYWNPASLRLKYACIPEAAVRRYCNEELRVTGGEGGFINSPGYPLYYLGGSTCGWTFKAAPGKRVVLTLHDLDIRGPEADGSCVDIVRVRDRGRTLFEECGGAAGVKVVSDSNLLTLDLVASKRLYTARGFFLQYQALGCPEIAAPNGSYILNSTESSRTLSCESNTVFPDIKHRRRTLVCKDGKWNESSLAIPSCVATSAVILKTEDEHHRLSSLSGDNILGAGVRIGRGEDAVAAVNGIDMDSAQSGTMKEADYVVDVVLPTVLIALLFVGNAIIVYIIFQYRKRKVPQSQQGEDVALQNTGVPQV